MKRNDSRMGEIRKFSVELIVRASARLCKKCERGSRRFQLALVRKYIVLIWERRIFFLSIVYLIFKNPFKISKNLHSSTDLHFPFDLILFFFTRDFINELICTFYNNWFISKRKNKFKSNNKKRFSNISVKYIYFAKYLYECVIR